MPRAGADGAGSSPARLLTEIDAEFPADTFFPAWDKRRFARTAHEPRETAEGLRYAFVTYKRLPEGA